MPAQANPSLGAILLSPSVLVTFIVCAFLAALAFWLWSLWQRRQREGSLGEQRKLQEETLSRLLDSVAQDKETLIADYEARVRARDERIAALEGETARLRDRLSSTGLLGLFGGRQRDAVSALLLENEQLHELLAAKQVELRDLMADMTAKLMARIDAQAQESAHAVRYKQALLSAFLQRDEARRLLDGLIADGTVKESQSPELPTQSS
jgi:hypothetical protein